MCVKVCITFEFMKNAKTVRVHNEYVTGFRWRFSLRSMKPHLRIRKTYADALRRARRGQHETLTA